MRKKRRYREPKWTIHDERESEKFQLEVFTAEMENRLDDSLQKIVSELQREQVKTQERQKKLKEEADKIDAESETMSEEAYDNAVNDNQFALMEADMEEIFAEEELVAFHEVRIMYAMKHLEINIKMLLNRAFPQTPVKALFKWDALADFLKVRYIDIKTIEAYKEVDQLRQVNNFVKHAVGPDKSMQHIPEFKGLVYPTSESLDRFYQRIQRAPEAFVNSLLSAVYQYLYEFDGRRIRSMVEELAMRMDHKAAKRFIEEFSRRYQ